MLARERIITYTRLSLVVLFLLIPTVVSYEPMAGCDLGLQPNTPISLEVGDYINISTWLNTTSNADSWCFYNITHNANRATINHTWVDESAWPFAFEGTIHTGYLANMQGFAFSPIINENDTLGTINYTTQHCGRLWINITSVDVQYGGNPVTINNVYNTSFTIYPQNITNPSTTNSSDTIEITYDTPYNNVTIRGNQSGYPTTPSSGTLIYQGANNSYNHTGLGAGETWYYSLWGSDSVNGQPWYSQDYVTTTGTTQSPPVIGECIPYYINATGLWFNITLDITNGQVALIVSENENMSSNTTHWTNLTDTQHSTNNYRFNLSNDFTANCTVYYQYKAFNKSQPDVFTNTYSGNITLWEPQISLWTTNGFVDGVTEASYFYVYGNTTITIKNGAPFDVNYYLDSSYKGQQHSDINATTSHQYTTLEPDTSYNWSITVLTEGLTNYTATKQWSFTTSANMYNINHFYPNSTEITRPPSQLNATTSDNFVGNVSQAYKYWGGENKSINYTISFWNMTPIVDCWTTLRQYETTGNPLYDTFYGTDFIWGNTTYKWRVQAFDGVEWYNYTYNYTTIEKVTTGIGSRNARYDVDNSGTSIDVFDVSVDWIHRTTAGYAPYEGLFDVNNDDEVDVFDVTLIWAQRSVG